MRCEAGPMGNPMGNRIQDMLDMAFELHGCIVPEGYAFTLWHEVVAILPWLDAEESAGIIPLRGAESAEGMLLAKRSRLVLRLPVELAAQAEELSGKELDVGSSLLRVGAASKRPLQAYPTLHSHMVESAEDEEMFTSGVAARLQEMNVECKWICGKRHAITDTGRSLCGYSLVLHDLKPDASLLVQRAGLGGSRRFGCGIFIPYKTISCLD
jgi:CRISPR-associated protein Cas6